MKAVILLFFAVLFMSACKNSKQTNSIINTKNQTIEPETIEDIKKHIEYQKNIASDEQDPETPYQPTEKDLELVVKITSEGLRSKGYRAISEEIFDQRLEEVFGIRASEKTNCKMHFSNNYISIFAKEDQGNYNELLKDEFGNSSLKPILFIMRKDHIITEMQTLSNLINFNEDGSYRINIEPYIIHRNRYIFNNDAASLAWLVNNQPIFLKRLLLDFGYDKEPRINGKVLSITYNNEYPELIGKLFFIKDCQNKLQIRKGLLKYIEENTSANDNRFIYALARYLWVLYDGDEYKIFDEDPSKKFTAVEKAEIVANIANIENPAREKYKSLESSDVWNIPGSSLYNLSVSHPEVIKIIEQHNYFGLPKMKEIIAKLQDEAPPTPADPE